MRNVETSPDFMDMAASDWRRSRPDLEALTGLGRLTRLAGRVDRGLAALCEEQGLKPGQFQVLSALRRREPQAMGASELAQAAMLTSGAMTPILDRLEAQGLLRRQANDADRRAQRITITPKGRSIVDRALDLELARHREINAHLSVEERETLAAILRKLLLAVERG